MNSELNSFPDHPGGEFPYFDGCHLSQGGEESNQLGSQSIQFQGYRPKEAA